MNRKERSLFRTSPLQFTVQGVNICFSLFKFPGDVSIQPLKFKLEKKLSHVVWMLNKTETTSLSEMFSSWDSLCVCVFAYGHAYRSVCVWQGTELLPFLEAPPAQGSICSPLYSICSVPLSLTQSLIQGDYELTSHHHSFASLGQHDFSSVFMISTFAKEQKSLWKQSCIR